MDKNPSKQISSAIDNLLKTGRLVTQTGLDLQQVRIYIGANCVTYVGNIYYHWTCDKVFGTFVYVDLKFSVIKFLIYHKINWIQSLSDDIHALQL